MCVAELHWKRDLTEDCRSDSGVAGTENIAGIAGFAEASENRNQSRPKRIGSMIWQFTSTCCWNS